MPISASNAPCTSARTTVKTRTTALWTGFWWVPTKPIPLWISAPTASPSVSAERLYKAPGTAGAFFSVARLDREPKSRYDEFGNL